MPIIGSYWHLLWHDYEYPYNGIIHYVNKLQSKIVTCYFGSHKTIIANDYKSIKEVLTKQEFNGRPINVDIVLQRAFGKSLGIFSVIFLKKIKYISNKNTKINAFHIFN